LPGEEGEGRRALLDDRLDCGNKWRGKTQREPQQKEERYFAIKVNRSIFAATEKKNRKAARKILDRHN